MRISLSEIRLTNSGWDGASPLCTPRGMAKVQRDERRALRQQAPVGGKQHHGATFSEPRGLLAVAMKQWTARQPAHPSARPLA